MNIQGYKALRAFLRIGDSKVRVVVLDTQENTADVETLEPIELPSGILIKPGVKARVLASLLEL